MQWYEWRNVQETLITFGRAVQGIAPYTVEIQTNTATCPTAYCDYTHRLIAVNPSVLPEALPKEQYTLTRAMLVHEAGHRRFTTPIRMDKLLHQVTNILEDQRIEYLMCDAFSGLRRLIAVLAETFYAGSPVLSPEDHTPGQVMAALLQVRWADRLGLPLKGTLSARNRPLYDRCLPLAREAWHAPDTLAVQALAQQIIDILGMREDDVMPAWVTTALDALGECQGQRSEEDRAECGRPGDGEGGESGRDMGEKGGDDIGSVRDRDSSAGMPALPSTDTAGTSEFLIEAKPYIELVERMTPLAQELADELALTWREGGEEYAARGRRLSIRELLHNPDQPFLSETETKQPPRMSLRILVDHSTSMNLEGAERRTRIASVADGVMMLHLFALQAGIEHEIAVIPNDVRLANLQSGELGLALIAGMVPALTWWEDLGKNIELHARELLDRPEELKLVLAIHDGYPNDGDIAKEACRRYKGKVEIIGVGIDLDEDCSRQMALIFPENRLLLCRKAEELPTKLAAIVRSIYGL